MEAFFVSQVGCTYTHYQGQPCPYRAINEDSMMQKKTLHSLFGQNASARGCSASELTALLSKLLVPGIAILAISYPEVDQRNHRSLDTLTHKLRAHGFGMAADSIAAGSPYILFDDLTQGMKVLHEIQQDSFAISARLYFDGREGADAEAAIGAILHPAEKPELAHAG